MLEKISTKELVEELKEREGVKQNMPNRIRIRSYPSMVRQ